MFTHVTCNSRKTPRLAGITISIFKNKGDERMLKPSGFSLRSLSAKGLEQRDQDMVKPELADEQCGFRCCRSRMDQILLCIECFKSSGNTAKSLHLCCDP